MPVIPGLTRSHFTNGGSNAAPTPRLTQARIKQDGETFSFKWKARGSHGEVYSLRAAGNILKSERNTTYKMPEWWGFLVRCSCPNFPKQEVETLREK